MPAGASCCAGSRGRSVCRRQRAGATGRERRGAAARQAAHPCCCCGGSRGQARWSWCRGAAVEIWRLPCPLRRPQTPAGWRQRCGEGSGDGASRQLQPLALPAPVLAAARRASRDPACGQRSPAGQRLAVGGGDCSAGCCRFVVHVSTCIRRQRSPCCPLARAAGRVGRRRQVRSLVPKSSGVACRGRVAPAPTLILTGLSELVEVQVLAPCVLRKCSVGSLTQGQCQGGLVWGQASQEGRGS